MRPYPNDVPNNQHSEAAWDCRKVSEKLSRLDSTVVDAQQIAQASSLDELATVFSEQSSVLEEEAIQNEFNNSISDFGYNNSELYSKVRQEEASHSEESQAIKEVRNHVPREYRYERSEDEILQLIKEY